MKKRIVYLTESDLFKITKRIIKEEQLREGIFDGISNVFQGLKGVWRGEGYDFFRFMNQLKNTVGDLKKQHKSIEKLNNLKNKVSNSKMPPEKKAELITEIDRLIAAFERYNEELNQVEQNVKNRLAGNTSYVPYIDKNKDKEHHRQHHKKTKDVVEPYKDLTQNEKRELEKYGYYDEEDYEDIFIPNINQSAQNQATIIINGKPMTIEDKTKSNLKRPNKNLSYDPANNDKNKFSEPKPKDKNLPNIVTPPGNNVSERRYKRY